MPVHSRQLAIGKPAARAGFEARQKARRFPARSECQRRPSIPSVIPSSPYPTPSRRAAALNDAAAKRLLLLAAVTAYCEAVARVTLTDRQSGITLRGNVAEYIEAILELIPPGEIDLFHAVAALRDATIEYLSRAVLDLAPVVTVEANLSMPSLFWAWRIYADPNRSAELVARNMIPHPSFMPTEFEALSK
ncbi:hypothetical protein HAP41_0000033400 [Bradyrhizobium barranii subsp. apii]|uniref:Uncharacterized protein n=1 Tax=Bradyrhizobium barranii subsp. apii TaxID=2819348 RepID=A0A8T5VGD2_9BRAD|nr:hypothetical protein [Bradyrhizobium barranii]UPT85187.1 hypothetical protein HAP41_0000033400 [Bradyrhizobium barranii subsp. apii]